MSVTTKPSVISSTPRMTPRTLSRSLSSTVPPLIASAVTHGKKKWSNWASIRSAYPSYYHTPTTTEDIQRIITFAHKHNHKVRIVGTGHSPSDIAACHQHMIDLTHYNRLISISTASRLVRCQSGLLLGDLITQLTAHHLSLPTYGSIADQTVGGILGTGTHGTGSRCGIMSTSVVSVLLLTPSGELMEVTQESDEDLFSAVLLNLGCLGVVCELTLRAVPAFDLTLEEEIQPFSYVVKHLEEIVASTDYPRLHWYPHVDRVAVHRMHREESGKGAEETIDHSNFFSFLASTLLSAFTPFWLYVVKKVDWFMLHVVNQLLLFVALYVHSLTPIINTLLFHYTHPRSSRRHTAPVEHQMIFDCGIKQHVTEWMVPRAALVDALMSLHHLITTHSLMVDWPVEIRFIAADDILLSPASSGAVASINIISYRPFNRDHPMQHTYFHLFEERMRALGGRPHWAKPFECSRRELSELYDEARLQRFEAVRRRLDGGGMFVNEYVERVLDVSGEGGWRGEEVKVEGLNRKELADVEERKEG